MLLVKTEVRPSSIHGLGLFAQEWIATGTPVSRWMAKHDYMLTRDEWWALPDRLREFLYDFVWYGLKGKVYGTVDNGRFTNHSAKPNLRWDARTKTMSAARDIAAGEELTENYAEFDKGFDEYKAELH